jgi:TonB family protein
MKPRTSITLAVFAALAFAAPLAAQDTPRGPTLLRVAASSGAIELSLDSATIARAGDSTFVAIAASRFPPDSTRRGADGKMEIQALDCARTRSLGRWSSYFAGDVPLPVEDEEAPNRPPGWQPVEAGELPVFQAICGYLLGSFATSLPVTVEATALEAGPVLANGRQVAQTLARAYPRPLRDAGVSGTVMLRMQVTTEGRADPATVKVLWATRPQFTAAAMQVVARMRWRPATVDGRVTAAWITVPVTFAVLP